MYKDRKEAGEKLAQALGLSQLENPVVFGLARGGLPVAEIVAGVLNCPLDILVVRKLSSCRYPEFGFGAIAPGETEIIDWMTAEKLGLTPFDIEQITKSEKKELYRRLGEYRESIKYESLSGKEAIVVDDGIATGVSVKAAIAFLRILEPKRIIVAAPVCARDTEKEIMKETDGVICIISDPSFMAVGQYYSNFPQLTDEEVVSILKKCQTKVKMSSFCKVEMSGF
ncbi:MAG: phosphoribosyltransferase family protein [Patescibacteria group bacterium]|nr:phosphoribosyltransferase family protein [Patescibacteria group bacterium]